ncbi:hypothetical protein S40288_06763 [Stachybotrys chartarum IBT 40288]|nr:hypothetical protein S40288_06763 [Stachybotrys chartarum IBT 40288]
MHWNVAAALLGMAGSAAAQIITTPYHDPNTGIDFYRYTSKSYSFGLVVPETLGEDFIGQMVVPLTETGGWGSVSLRGGMLGGLLFVAWADGDEVVTTFRLAGSYANPDVYTGTPVAALPIANGTFVNSTHLSYTFLCQGCVLEDTTNFLATNKIFGWAISVEDPTDVSDPASALTYHAAGFGQYAVDLEGAANANYDLWASWAAAEASPAPPATTPAPVPGNGTITEPIVFNTTYDVIVAGGGTAGIIAAERIAESGLSVLLIERGPANTVALGSTAGLPWNNSLTQYDVPSLGSSLSSVVGTKYCSDTASTAGCLLGGSSSINGLNFIRPAAHDWQRWPAGWNSDDVSAAAERLYERNPGTTSPSADGEHYDDHAFKVLSSYLDTKGWNEVDSIESPNEKHQIYSRPSWSIKDNMRAGPARTYIPFAQALPNFTLKLNSKVVQVVRTGSQVTGVLVANEDGSRQIINLKANGKVVLAAGALSTPRILWNSGIGRSDALEIVQSGASQTGVTLPDEADWIDLPVGHNLQDHAQVMLQFTDTTNFTAYNFNDIAIDPVSSDLDLYYQGSGPITQAAQRIHIWTSVNSTDGRPRYLQGTGSAMASGVVTLRTFLTHGTSTVGELGITASGNTVLNTKPWLIDQADRDAMGSFVQWWLDAVKAPESPLKYIDAGATVDSILSTKLISGDHWVGSARMGEDDGTNVVDLDTKVYGTDNLFVVDASIHPDLPTGNTQSIIMITAEHAAEKIVAHVGGISNGNTGGNGTVPTPVPTPTPTTPGCRRSVRRSAPASRFRFRKRSSAM